MRRPIPFRWFIIMFVVLISFSTLLVSGTAIYAIRRMTVNRTTLARARQKADDLARRTEGLLSGVEQILYPLVEASLLLEPDRFSQIADTALDDLPLARALYFLDENGLTFAVENRDARGPRYQGYLGIDFSRTPLFLDLDVEYQPIWSDKFISTLSGDTSIGVGLKIGGHAAVAELSLEALLETVQTASDEDIRLWVIDGRGELVADTGGGAESGVVNVRGREIVRSALDGRELPSVMVWDDRKYHPASSRSEELGWTFLVGSPAGFGNPQIRGTVADLVLLFTSFLIFALVFSPIWSRRIVEVVRTLGTLSDRIAEGLAPNIQKHGSIREFRDLETNLIIMSDRILEREAAMQALNLELEERVNERTAALESSNVELRSTLDDLNRMQGMLVRTEKLAALGRLVAGIAHELNTPIGNALMAVTSVSDQIKEQRAHLGPLSPESGLEDVFGDAEAGLDIAYRNIERAVELVKSFKQVSTDQIQTVRRKFRLSETIGDVLVTLKPTLKRSPHTVAFENRDADIILDSHPGILAQVLTNLITNAVRHAWNDDESGTITIRSGKTEDGVLARITIEDDGNGIPEDIRSKVFDPFFTTRMGNEGTGLGLNIALNQTIDILGGSLDFESTEGTGTTFILEIPTVAPD